MSLASAERRSLDHHAAPGAQTAQRMRRRVICGGTLTWTEVETSVRTCIGTTTGQHTYRAVDAMHSEKAKSNELQCYVSTQLMLSGAPLSYPAAHP